MGKINKIKLSGTTYDIQDKNATKTVELTQAEYDALVTGGTVDPNTFYVITDATEVDISQYWTSAQTNSAITQAVSGKQDTLVSGTNIKTINNESILGSGNIDIQGGGGKAIEAGRGISITTGATADTVSFNLPISAGTGTSTIIEGNAKKAQSFYSHAEGHQTEANKSYSHAEGNNTKANGLQSHAEGALTNANGVSSHAEGTFTIANNESEHASGQYNNSVSASTTFGDSGNTLFSVGNGTADNARHNAFEIRQNGDIYISSGGTDIKLQDNLGSTIEISSAITSGDTNPVQGGVLYDKFDEIEQVTAAGLNALNDRLSEDEEVTAASLNALNDNFGGMKLVKLTQAEYNSLATKDSSTLYIIVN